MAHLISSRRSLEPFKSGKPKKPWRAQVYHYGKNVSLGTFSSERAALERECLEWERYLWGDDCE